MKNINLIILMLLIIVTSGWAYNYNGTVESSTVSLNSMPPATPSQIGPEYPNTDLLSRRARLSWEALEHISFYTVQIATDWEFNNILIEHTVIGMANDVADLPSGNTTYYWRVSATNCAGTSSYSYKRDLKTSDMTSINVGGYAAPTMTDIDADGLLDMLVGNHDGKLARYEQTAVNSFSLNLITSNFSGIDVGVGNSPTVLDLDGNGLLDLIIGRGDGTLQHYEQDSERSASFSYISALSGIDAGSWSKPTFTDLDMDARLDLLVGNQEGNIRHYEQDAKYSTSFTLVSNKFNSIDVGGDSSPMLCYYDTDNNLDLFIGNADGRIQLYDQSGITSTTFASVTSDWKDITVGERSVLSQTDLNGDRRVDLLIGSSDGIVGIKKGDTYRIDVSMSTDAAENITETSADLGGRFSNNNGVPVQRRGVIYSTTNPPTMTDNMVTMGCVSGSFSERVSGLTPNTTYYFRTFGCNCYGTFYSSTIKSFTTKADISLPIELTSFSVKIVNQSVLLVWKTESETNNKGFIVERSQDGNSWITISSYINNSELEGQGNISVQTDYSYLDKEVEPGMTYYYRISDVSIENVVKIHESLSITLDALPELTKMDAAYPNPFNPTTTISYDIASEAFVTMKIYDMQGRELETLVNESMPPGSYTVHFDGSDLASGVYICQLTSGNNMKIIKMLLVK